MMQKNLRQTIWKSLGRFIAIVAIIALGCAIFVGLRVTKADMVATGQKYTDAQNMFDIRLLNTYGWTQKEVDAVAKMDGIVDAEGSATLDVFARIADADEDSVYRLHSIPKAVNRVYLLGGRMPEKEDECLVDGERYGDAILGEEVVISEANTESTLDSLNHHTYTVVGYISTPLYMDMSRGNTSLGSGSLNSYIYIPADAMNVDYFTEINVTIPGNWAVYSDEYTDAMDEMVERLEPELIQLAKNRFAGLKEDAEKEYADGRKQYEEGKAEAEQELADALKQLEEGQAEIDKNRLELEDGEKQLAEGQKQLDENYSTIAQSKLELEKTKADTYAQLADANTELLNNFKLVTESQKQVADGLTQIQDGLKQIDDGLAQIKENLPLLELVTGAAKLQVQTTQKSLDAAKLAGDKTLIASLETRLAEQTAKYEEYQTQLDTAKQTQTELEAKKTELEVQKAELETTQKTLTDSLNAINAGFVELESNKILADGQFAAAAAQLEAGQLELDAAQKELNEKKAELEAGKKALEEGQAELDAGRAEYETGEAEAEAELAEAEAELEEARKTIDQMQSPDTYLLTRNTNLGYMALDSNSDIVFGIAKVFPAFFLLVAALVCITTMTRMIEEERTQIGTLKALGYSNWSIISKYLLYSGSAAVIGCGLGVLVGSVVFPWILWEAYGIIFNVTPKVELVFDWKLSLAIAAAYTAVSSAVTWYCCRRTLKEVPAELIRPKAPASGKKILLEYLPFWKSISFLNKVMLRNVVRYRQRLLMMMAGIGGCTALLLTGFGVWDSVADIANIQFDEVAVYDMQVYFSEGQSEQDQKQIRDELKTDASKVGFFYQTSVELEFDGSNREISLMMPDKNVKHFMNFRWDGETLDTPDAGEALLSIGAAEMLGIRTGDTVTVRNTALQTLTVKVVGLFENYVNNLMIVSPETVKSQWTEVPEYQMAFVNVREGKDVHEVGARISGMEDVMNLSISADLAEQVNFMMDALVLVVITVIICAGLLGAIVLYNLTNINITERIREIATIKVLGFNSKETSAYVFKENILLSVLGAGFGLFGGKWLLDFVMSQIKIDMVWFQSRLTVPSYIFSVILTLLTAVIVDFVFHFKLEKINMAEALKSVE